MNQELQAAAGTKQQYERDTWTYAQENQQLRAQLQALEAEADEK